MKRAAVQLALSLACWTVLALLAVVNHALYNLSLGEPADVGEKLGPTLLDYGIWAALTPIIFALVKRVPFTRATWGRAAVVNLGAFGATTLFHDAVVEWANPSALPRSFHGRPLELRLLSGFDNDVWMYGSILVVASGVHYYRRFRERDLAAARLGEELVRAELQALRNQLNPHLLFNALNSVAALMHEDVRAADDMLVDLSHLLRVYLSGDPRQETTLREELELVDAYVGIQKHRFAERLTFTRDVTDDLLGASVPSLLLQPLVENAILHGVAPLTRAARVSVRAEARDGALVLVVADDGAGMKDGGAEGIGLANTRARLRQLYGDAQALELTTRPGAGVTVTITLPRRAVATPEGGGVRDEIRTLIVDDEPLARRRVESLLQDDDEFEVVGTCADGAAALDAVAELRPDLVFLDVQMPGLDGFGVLEALALALPAKDLPAIVFATAHDQYAVRAFDACAVDYLLKPFKRERFVASLARVKEKLARAHAPRESEPPPPLAALATMVREDRDRLVVRSQGKMVFLKTDEITWVEASANYVLIHARAEVHQVREKIGDFERMLPKEKFLRIHRSILVRLDAIAEVQPCGGGEHVVILRSGEELSLGRSYLEGLTRVVAGR